LLAGPTAPSASCASAGHLPDEFLPLAAFAGDRSLTVVSMEKTRSGNRRYLSRSIKEHYKNKILPQFPLMLDCMSASRSMIGCIYYMMWLG
jgi:hypothetical protein